MKLQVFEKQHLAASPETGSCNSGAWLLLLDIFRM